MIVFYKLWDTLIEKNMTKSQLGQMLGCSKSTLAKISKDEYVSLEILDKICTLLNCKIEDVIRHQP